MKNQNQNQTGGAPRFHSKSNGAKAGWKFVTTKTDENGASYHYFKNDKHPRVWKKTTMNVSHAFTRVSYHIEGTTEEHGRTREAGWSAEAVAERFPLILHTMKAVKAHPVYKAL